MEKKIFAIFHLAAVVPTKQVLRDYQKAVKVNSYGTNYLANQIIKNKSTNWLLFASTSHVYNFSETSIKEKSKLLTISEYGKTKVLAEKYLLKKNLRTCIIRIFSYTHHSQNIQFIVPSINKKFLKSKMIKFKNINHVRDFIDLSDILSAIKALLKKRKTGVYNVGSGSAINLIRIIKYFSKFYGKNYVISGTNKKTKLVADISKLKKLGWYPKKDISYILKNYSLKKN